MYRVIKYFTDLQDSNHAYNVGDEFPRQGMRVKAERFAELASAENRQKTPLIELVDEPAADVAAEDAEDDAAEETTEEDSEVDEKPKRKRKKAETE